MGRGGLDPGAPATVPPARDSQSMVYDAAHGQIVMFGGEGASLNPLNDTWVWNGTNWIQQNPANSPPARRGQGMAYDAALGEVIMFGGYNGSTYLNDTWAWNGTSWTQLSTSSSPSGRQSGNGFTYDAAQNQLIMFGGYGGTQLGDFWQFAVPQNLGSVNVCPTGTSTPSPCKTTSALTYNFSTTTSLGTPQVVTQGATGLDFSQANGGNCSGTISAGNSCTLDVTFAPVAPGLRSGAVNLVDNVGNLLVSSPIYGNGLAPEIAFNSSAPASVDLGTYSLSVPYGVAVDAAGGIYISEAGLVLKKTPGGVQPVVGEFGSPHGLAVDGAGNLYVADNEFGKLIKVPANGTAQSIIYPSSGSFGTPIGVAADGAGNIFVADSQNQEVVEIPANGGPNVVVYSPAPAGGFPVAVAVDGAGDVFVALNYPGSVMEIPAGCASTSCRITVGTGWNQPSSLAIDAAGDMFVADPGLAGGQWPDPRSPVRLCERQLPDPSGRWFRHHRGSQCVRCRRGWPRERLLRQHRNQRVFARIRHRPSERNSAVPGIGESWPG